MLNTIDDCIDALMRLRKEIKRRPDPDLLAARVIAAEQSRQTGKSYENFINGDYDRAFGVRTALAAIKYGRRSA